jgi:hypothetical protein
MNHLCLKKIEKNKVVYLTYSIKKASIVLILSILIVFGFKSVDTEKLLSNGCSYSDGLEPSNSVDSNSS